VKRYLLYLVLVSTAFSGCSSSYNQSVAGKYSRRPVYRSPDGKTTWSYSNTTELKADGTYIDSTDRGGKYKVLAAGTYEVRGKTIAFHAKTGPQAGTVQTYNFDGKAIAPDKFFKRAKE
jgi:hypothetical protein